MTEYDGRDMECRDKIHYFAVSILKSKRKPENKTLICLENHFIDDFF